MEKTDNWRDKLSLMRKTQIKGQKIVPGKKPCHLDTASSILLAANAVQSVLGCDRRGDVCPAHTPGSAMVWVLLWMQCSHPGVLFYLLLHSYTFPHQCSSRKRVSKTISPFRALMNGSQPGISLELL